MKKFDFTGLPWNVLFGIGAVKRVPEILERLGFRRALILSTPGRDGQVQALLSLPGMTAAATYSNAAVHVPAGIVEEARSVARRAAADCTISLGGGSITGLGKALRFKDGIPQIAIPTTYAGSEMTNLWGITEGKVKRTWRDAGVLPVAVIYDPELLVSLPPSVAGPSALNAMAQAVANVSGVTINPIVALLAREAIRILACGLPRIMDRANDIEAHSDMLYGACLAGAALGTGQTGLHHRICHTLGGMYNLPHADLHAVILPYSVAFNARGAREGTEMIAAALDADDAAERLYELMRLVCARPSLRELGLTEPDLNAAAAAVTHTSIENPVPVTREGVRRLLQDAFEGRSPDAANYVE